MHHIARISVLIAAFGLLAGTAFAEAEEGWSFKFEPLFLQAYGNEGIVSINEFSGGPSTTEIREVEYDGGTGFAVGFEQRGGTWGWGVDLWIFDTDGSATTGQVTSDFANSISRSVSTFFTGRSAPDVGTGDFVEARTMEEVETTNIDIYAVRTIAEHDKSRIDVRFGINATNFEQGQVATILDAAGPDSIFTGEAETDTLFGPMVALVIQGGGGRHHVEGVLSQSIVAGDADFSNSAAFPTTTGFGFNNVSYSRSISLPVSELNATWLYGVNDRFAIGLGLFAAAYWDAPSGGSASFFGLASDQTVVMSGINLALRFQ